MTYMEELGMRAKKAAKTVQYLGQTQKNTGLRMAADELIAQQEYILEENEKDIREAQENGMKPSLVDRLCLTRERIEGMAEGLRQIGELPDPIGEVISMNERPNGLKIGKRRVPLGVVGIIYESRPNVTADAFGLCLKTGNVTILRGGKDAIHSNIAISKVLKEGLKKAGITEEAFADWDSFGEAMEKIRALDEDVYGYIAGQGSSYIVNTVMASTDEGKKMLESELTEDTINSEEFAAAFKTAANLDQANGSEHTTDDNGNLMAEFNTNGKAGVLFNGVWNASGIDASLTDAIEPALFPGNIAIASAGGGLAVANNMSDEKTELALEFIKYMTSAEVQEKIFTGVQANPCNTTVDLNALAEESDDAATRKLAQACSQVNEADTVVIDMNYTWGSDVDKAIINALMECAVSGTDIDARFAALQTELIALVA